MAIKDSNNLRQKTGHILAKRILVWRGIRKILAGLPAQLLGWKLLAHNEFIMTFYYVTGAKWKLKIHLRLQ